jgi:hypothetical protein
MMGIGRKHLAPMLGALASAAAIGTAPLASIFRDVWLVMGV